MASLATSTMGSSFGDHDGYLQMEGPGSFPWGLDAACVNSTAGFEPAGVYMFGQESGFDSGSSLKSDWTTDSSLFAGPENGEWDLESLLNSATETCYDAVSHPKHESSLPITTDFSALTDVSFEAQKDIPSPASTADSGYESPEVALSPSSEGCYESAGSPDVQFPEPTIEVSPEDLSLLQSLLDEAQEPIIEPQVEMDGLLAVTLPVLESHKPVRQTFRKKMSKPYSTKEKKERKRAQNKNAAARYREKKRAEAQEVYEEQTKMEEKNKSLQDKVTLITREIQSLKELLIEVYRAKGIVE